MSNKDEMVKPIHCAFLDEEMGAANDLRYKSVLLGERLFSDNANVGQILVELNTLAEEMKSFESKIVNFPILTFFYADIGRTFLNLKSFETAIQYALAGVEVNQVDEDKEGVLTNKSVLLDTACFMEAYEQALKILDDNPDLNNPRLYKLIESKPVNASSDQMFEKLLRTKKRPKSFVYCVDKKLGAEESVIRTLMHEMGDSRATVIKYLSH